MGRPLSNVSLYPFRAMDTGKWTWAVGAPLVWEVGREGSGFIEIVPVGFWTDLGSVPALARLFINPADPELALPFVLHDWLLETHGPDCQLFALSQMYEAMRHQGTALRRRMPMAIAVGVAIDRW